MKIMPAMSDWRRFFEIVEESDFLSGRSNDWNATFDWLVKPANAVKVAEGNYTNKKSSSDLISSIESTFKIIPSTLLEYFE